MATDKKVASTNSAHEPYLLRWELSSAKNQRIQVRRDFYPPDHRYPMHEHDWAEVLIVEHGNLLHRGPTWNQRLQRGDIALIPKSCQHELASPPRESCVIVNIAVHEDFVAALQLVQEDTLLATLMGAGDPILRRLSSFDLVLCARMITEACAVSDHRLSLSLLLFLLDRCSQERRHGDLPSGLSEALDALSKPEYLREGLSFLTRWTGYHGDHITRLIKQHHGCTAVEMITQLRLDYLADQLLHTSRTIAEICHDCGISNRTHANKRFKERYGCTPAALRRRQ